MNATLSACAAIFAAASTAGAVNVLVLSSGNAGIDDAVTQALQSRGHAVTLGPQFYLFDGQEDLSKYQTVYFQANANWNNGDMPDSGQQALYDFVDAGGGLVTGEWFLYKIFYQGNLATLRPASPAAMSGWTYESPDTFIKAAPDAALNKGLPDSFAFPMDSYGGTESHMRPSCPGGTVFYSSQIADAGVIGWEYGFGRVLCFATTNGAGQVNDPEFGTLLGNAMSWAALGGHGGHGYTPDCDLDGSLTLFDFLCFTNAFNAGAEYADCDHDGAFSLFDFLCFVNTFNNGC